MKISQFLVPFLALGGAVAVRAETPQIGGQLQLVATNPRAVVPPFSALKHTDVRAVISGTVARVTLQQKFQNTARVPVEAIYTFPLPPTAAVDAMEFQIGKRRIIGQIKRKDVARRVYENAKRDGKRAALLDQQRPDIFTQHVANVMPGDALTVKISFVQTLPYRKGGYEWAFPTVVGPRYVPSGGYYAPNQRGAPSQNAKLPPKNQIGAQAVVTDADKITPPIAPPGTRAGHDLSLRVELDAGVPLGNIRSLLHPISVTKRGASRASIALVNLKTLPNQDFILRYQIAGQDVQSGVLTHPDGRGGGYFQMVVQPPHTPTREQIVPRELVFVVDQTGSQSGWPMEKSKETMQLALSKLRPNDRVQVLGFNTDVYPCFDKPVAPTAQNVAKARKFVAGLNAEGGTDILKALAVALKIPADPKRLRIVIYMTDGYVGDDMQIADYLRKNRGSTRVFPFGMGNSVNRFLIEQMARQGRGAADYLTVDPDNALPKERKNAREAVERFYARMATPVLLDPKASFAGLPIKDVFPSVLNDVFDFGPLVISGRYTKAAKGFVTLRGISGTKSWTRRIPVNFGAKTQNPALETLWARAKVENLMEQDYLGAQIGKPDPKIQGEIVQTALAHRLLTQWTSFVAVEQKIVNPGGKNRRTDVPVNIPKGVNYKKATGLGHGISNAPRVAKNPAAIPATPPFFSARPGDPLISIAAPADAQKVSAILPDGTPLPLVFDALTRLWQAHFDIPTHAAQGEYRVAILISCKNGERLRFDLNFRVDTSAPGGKGAIWSQNGWAQLKVTAGEAWRVAAITPWGERVELSRGHNGEFAAQVAVPVEFADKAGVVRYILTDKAHNRAEIAVDWTK